MKFNIVVTETILCRYDVVEVEAEDIEAARNIAEAMRVQGELGEACEWVEDVDLDAEEEG